MLNECARFDPHPLALFPKTVRTTKRNWNKTFSKPF